MPRPTAAQLERLVKQLATANASIAYLLRCADLGERPGKAEIEVIRLELAKVDAHYGGPVAAPRGK